MLQKETVVIIGASSPIAREIACEYAAQGYSLLLLGRKKNQLERLSHDLEIRYQVPVEIGVFDGMNKSEIESCYQAIYDKERILAGIIMAIGYLGDQLESEKNIDETARIMTINCNACCYFISLFANYFEERKKGFIIGISSVAGDRGRFSNYTYGAAKGAFSLYLQGLRARLHRSRVQVLTVKPGFTDTRMTYGKKGMFLVASPKKVALDIVKAQIKGKNEIYTPWFWKYIMFVIKQIPESIFKKLKL